MPPTSRTIDQLRDEQLRDLRVLLPGYDTRQGGEAWATATVLANVLAGIYANATFLDRQKFPDTADEAYLKRFAQIENVPRLGAQFAAGTGTATASFAASIADKAPLTNLTTGQKYVLVGAVSITVPTLQAPAYVTAVNAGDAANCDAGTILTFDNPPAGVNPQLKTQRIAGGDIAWTLQRWAREVLRVRRARPGSGNCPHVELLGDLCGGVEKCFVYPALRGTGTLDVVVVSSAASGSRVASPNVIARVLGAFEAGFVLGGGDVLPGIADDVLENTNVMTAAAQPTDLLITLRASAANGFDVWPPAAVTTTSTSWYYVSASTNAVTFTVPTPLSGTPVAPAVGNAIGVFFPTVGFAKGVISSVSGAPGGPWTVSVAKWSASNGSLPGESTVPANALLVPWSTQLYLLAGAADATIGSLALSGSVPDFFAALGPGEMTSLTADDVFRRARWPAITATDPVTGQPELTTDVTGRLIGAILEATDATDATAATVAITTGPLAATLAPSLATPAVPDASAIGAPPALLTLNRLYVVASR